MAETYARIDGIDAEDESTAARCGPNVVGGDHSSVPGAMAGLGVAKALLNFMLEKGATPAFAPS